MAMGRGDVPEEKVRGKQRERERDRGKEKRKRQARAVKTRAFVVCRKGGAGGGQVRNLGKRRGGIIIVQARTRSSPPAIR